MNALATILLGVALTLSGLYVVNHGIILAVRFGIKPWTIVCNDQGRYTFSFGKYSNIYSIDYPSREQAEVAMAKYRLELEEEELARTRRDGRDATFKECP